MIDDDVLRDMTVAAMTTGQFEDAHVPDTAEHRKAWAGMVAWVEHCKRTNTPMAIDNEWPSDRYADNVDALFGGDFLGQFEAETETKAAIRRVRDPEYWGVPYNTPIVPGMKPRPKPRARVRIPDALPPGWSPVSSESDLSDKVPDPAAVMAAVGIGAKVYTDADGNVVALDPGLPPEVASPTKIKRLLTDVRTVYDTLPKRVKEISPMTVVVPWTDPAMPYVRTEKDITDYMDATGQDGMTMGYTVMNTGVIMLNPTLMENTIPFRLSAMSKMQGLPYRMGITDRLGTLQHETGHFVAAALDSLPEFPQYVMTPDGLRVTTGLAPEEEEFYLNIIDNDPDMFNNLYAATDPHEGYAELYAEHRLGGRNQAWKDIADAYAEHYGWDD